MSLYNALFGVNPIAGVLLQALNTTPDAIPRFRDCYLDTEGEKPRICVYTRTGGGNRRDYESPGSRRASYGEEANYAGPWNSDLRELPGFLYDEDDDFDCTYASFYYEVPEAFQPIVDTLREIGAGAEKPGERWQRMLADLQERKQTPED